MAVNRRRHTWHYRPGEIVVAIELPQDELNEERAHALVREAIEQSLAGRVGGVFRRDQRRQDPIVFRARGMPPLAFLFYDLAEADTHDFVKKVVHEAHANNLEAFDTLRGAGLTPVGVMPHWLGSSQQDFGDGSPATLPRPANPPPGGRWRYHYVPSSRTVDFRGRLARGRGLHAVPVSILDTRPDWGRARRQAARFGRTNAQLQELVEFVGTEPLP